MTRLIAIILTYNEAGHIQDCIRSVSFADSVLVFDSYSTDATVELARQAGARVQQRVFDNYADQRNAALESVEGQAEWVLFIDADERVSPELAAEIRSALEQAEYAGWRMPRHNYIFNRLTLGAGWYPDYQTRLLRVGKAHYDPTRKVHEVVVLDGSLGTLQHPLVHHNYRDLAHFIAKQRRYTAYEAQILYQQGTRPRPQNYILQPLRHFRWRFFQLKGYQDGLHGLRLSLLMAWYEWRKYVLLRGLWKQGA
ncbi:MAG: glycosyltransferase family 2 protein [bacterium]|nr:glycosyltransferase family 2 protein [bacterium]